MHTRQPSKLAIEDVVSAVVLQEGLTSSNEEKETGHAVHEPSNVTDLLAPAQHADCSTLP